MKKIHILILILCFFSSAVLKGQTSVALTFTAEFNGTRVQLDSIYITNLSQGGDTMLYWPDTVLVLATDMSVGEYVPADFFVSNAYPNPFSNISNFTVHTSDHDMVRISVYDILGRTVMQFEKFLEPGIHEFTFYPGNENMYFLAIEKNNQIRVLKLTCTGHNRGKCRIEHQGTSPADLQRKMLNNIHSWAPGDTLKYMGFSTLTGNITGTDIISDNPTVSATYIFDLFYGIRCFDEPYIFDQRDSSIYRTVQIGTQCWMAENLKYLPFVNNHADFDTLTNNELPAIGVYGYNGSDVSSAKATSNYQTYGVLYNWYAVMDGAAASNSNPSGVRGLCPEGWHLPSGAELTVLVNYLDGSGVAGGKLKEACTTHWISPNEGATNESGFTALPSGYRYYFLDLNITGLTNFWSTRNWGITQAFALGLRYNLEQASILEWTKKYGFAARCVKD